MYFPNENVRGPHTISLRWRKYQTNSSRHNNTIVPFARQIVRVRSCVFCVNPAAGYRLKKERVKDIFFRFSLFSKFIVVRITRDA